MQECGCVSELSKKRNGSIISNWHQTQTWLIYEWDDKSPKHLILGLSDSYVSLYDAVEHDPKGKI